MEQHRNILDSPWVYFFEVATAYEILSASLRTKRSEVRTPHKGVLRSFRACHLKLNVHHRPGSISSFWFNIYSLSVFLAQKTNNVELFSLRLTAEG